MNLFIALNMPSGPDLFFLAIIVILLFGAKKLPELARGLGQSLGEFKKAKDEFEQELHKAAPPVTPAPPEQIAQQPLPAPQTIPQTQPTQPQQPL